MKRTLFLAIILAGCTVGPDYKAPERQVPENYVGATESQAATIDDASIAEWWQQFQDPLLNDLMHEAQHHNPSLRVATAQLREARARARVALSGLYPEVGFGASAQRQRLSENSQFGQFPGIELTNDTYKLGFDAGWELDLWGKQRRKREAAEAAAEAIEFAQQDVMVSVLAELGRAYVMMRGADYSLVLLRESIALQERTVKTIQRLVDGGLLNANSLTRAQAALADTAAREPELIAQRQSAMYAVAVLSGKTPEALNATLKATGELVQMPDLVQPDLPSDLLRRRPDIRMAERRLAGETAEVGVAMAALYPSISLTASIGLESQDIGELFESASRTWMIGPQLRLPIFDRGKLKALVEVEEAQVEAALARYEQSVLGAMLEVEQALVRYQQALVTRQRYAQTVKLNQQAELKTQRRFKAGEDSLLDLLDAQRQMVRSIADLANAEVQTRVQLIALYKALGGGWQVK